MARSGRLGPKSNCGAQRFAGSGRRFEPAGKQPLTVFRRNPAPSSNISPSRRSFGVLIAMY
jgi:hypothetical protein